MDYTYTCVNAGHEGDPNFIAAHPGWFTSQGLTSPKNCPTCRAWMRSQEDETIICVVCRREHLFTADFKVNFHRSRGKFVAETCGRWCAEALVRRRLAEQREQERLKAEAEKRERQRVYQSWGISFNSGSAWLSEQDQVDELAVKRAKGLAELPEGRALPELAFKSRLSSARRAHIGRHLPATCRPGKSPSALVDMLASLHDLLQAIAWVISQTEYPRRVYRDVGSGHFICVTDLGGHIEVTVLGIHRRLFMPSQLVPITTYDGVKLGAVQAKLHNGQWQ